MNSSVEKLLFRFGRFYNYIFFNMHKFVFGSDDIKKPQFLRYHIYCPIFSVFL